MTNDIASLIGSRICHDLISPIGAISNGMELMSMTQTSDGAEIELINDSVQHANARIRFFRIAFGIASPDQRIAKTEIMSILTANAMGGRLTYDWQIDCDIQRLEARVAFLIIQCFESALPRGGTITVSLDGDTWSLVASGPQLRFDAPLWDGLTNVFSTVSHSPAQVQFALLPEALKHTGRTVEISATDTQISAVLRPVAP